MAYHQVLALALQGKKFREPFSTGFRAPYEVFKSVCVLFTKKMLSENVYIFMA